MEHSSLLHHPFAKGRIENKLSPAPRVMERSWHVRWAEAVSVLTGRSVGIRCYEDLEPLPGETYK